MFSPRKINTVADILLMAVVHEGSHVEDGEAWAQAGFGPDGSAAAWSLNVSSTLAVDMTGSPAGNYDSMEGAIEATTGGSGGTITVSVSPSSYNLSPSQTGQFTATVTGSSNQNVTWSIYPTVGSISSSGLYTAPSTITSNQSVTVTATSVADSTASGSATVNLTTSSSGSTVYYYFEDQLGTARVVTDSTGSVCYDADFYPFGGERTPYTNSCSDTNNYKFTGKERDSESNLDNFGARYYGSITGRFMSPDPANAGADPTNPQSWNMYSYVLNNPETLIDPSGMYQCNNDQETADSCDLSGWEVESDDPPPPDPPLSPVIFVVDSYASSHPNNAPYLIDTGCQMSDAMCAMAFQFHPPVNIPQAPTISVQPPQPRARGYCAGQALKKNEVALALDVAGVGASFLPGGDAVVAVAQSTLSLAGGINSGMHQDTNGEVMSMTFYSLTILSPAAKAMGGVVGKSIPVLATLVSGVGTLEDVWHGYSDYNTCMAGAN